MFGGTNVRRPPDEEHCSNFTKRTVKLDGLTIMILGSFSYAGVGPIHKIEGILDKNFYVDILQNVMLPYASWKMPLEWMFQLTIGWLTTFCGQKSIFRKSLLLKSNDVKVLEKLQTSMLRNRNFNRVTIC